ncbi:MAG TPA: DUF4238 domain-containing protein, partial [Syntrophomonadaceae bacterium]|nr:DUF4238 domain-containing protein [Syntrophomonadaceae bacterium]
DESDKSLLQVETLVGRGMWLYEIKRILTNTAKILLTHKWSIFHPTGLEWITSDDPVICLNYYGNDSYDFDGGWGKTGSEVLFPLSPNHMLYTQVGKKAPPRIDLSPEMSTKLQRIVAEHGYRWIFSNKKIVDIESLRVRKVDEFAYNSEKDTWPRWGIEQKEAELNLRRKTES